MQVPMQVQCLYMMKKYNYQWFTTTDVDEYIFVTKNIEYNNTNNHDHGQSPMKEHIETLTKDDEPDLKNLIYDIPNHEEIGGLCMNSIPFGRNIQLEAEEKPQLLIDYIWRDKEDPWKMPFRRYKYIYNSKLVQDLGVHYLYKGGKDLRLDAKFQARLNHYKNSKDGVYDVFRKFDRLKKDTLLVDRYRESLIESLNYSS